MFTVAERNRVRAYAKGADTLPRELTAPLGATLVRSLEEAELRRALAALPENQ